MEASLLTGENEVLAIFINHGPKALTGQWRIQLPSSVGKKPKALDILSNRPVPISSVEDGSLVVDVQLPVYGVAAVWILETY